jgi:mono/diheme cytochrome c family protein
MKNLMFNILLVTAGLCTYLVADDRETLTLQQANEVGRTKSRFLKEVDVEEKVTDAIPKANVANYQESVGAILNKNCLACHGPEKSEGRLRVDELNSDLLTGPDVERWREIYNVISNSEMPPDDEPDYALADADRGKMVDWLSAELNKASLVRRNTQEHSSFRRLTKYEYNYALQDLLGLPYALANKLPPETVSEDGFKNSSELLQMSIMQFENYREIGLQALKRATTSHVGVECAGHTERTLGSQGIQHHYFKQLRLDHHIHHTQREPWLHQGKLRYSSDGLQHDYRVLRIHKQIVSVTHAHRPIWQ